MIAGAVIPCVYIGSVSDYCAMRVGKRTGKRLKSLGIYLAVVLLGSASPALADYEDGVNAAFAGDFDTAFREFSLAAEAGLDLAQYNLGILYFTGQGVDQDFAQAYTWTEAAAQQGHLAAQFNLASLLFEGQGIKRDRAAAVEWFGKAAKGGHPEAAFVLAKLYQEGDDVERSLVLAHAWASMAAANEHADGAALRSELEGRMNAEQLSQARRQFALWQIER